MGEDKPEELVVLAVTRAKFCEAFSPCVGLKTRASDFFLMGLFSLIDAILSQPMEDNLKEMPIAEDIKAALMGEENKFRDVYEYVVAYERGEWEKIVKLTEKLKVDEDEIQKLYLESVDWANQNFRRTGSKN